MPSPGIPASRPGIPGIPGHPDRGMFSVSQPGIPTGACFRRGIPASRPGHVFARQHPGIPASRASRPAGIPTAACFPGIPTAACFPGIPTDRGMFLRNSGRDEFRRIAEFQLTPNNVAALQFCRGSCGGNHRMTFDLRLAQVHYPTRAPKTRRGRERPAEWLCRC